jgi:multidrug transporter EmrE-like cation transporter
MTSTSLATTVCEMAEARTKLAVLKFISILLIIPGVAGLNLNGAKH